MENHHHEHGHAHEHHHHHEHGGMRGKIWLLVITALLLVAAVLIEKNCGLETCNCSWSTWCPTCW